MEYCKAFARSTRWNEEVSLINEEMRRTLQSLEKAAQLWRDRANGTDSTVWEEFNQGRRAYALKQAAMLDKMASTFTELWSGGGSKGRDGMGGGSRGGEGMDGDTVAMSRGTDGCGSSPGHVGSGGIVAHENPETGLTGEELGHGLDHGENVASANVVDGNDGNENTNILGRLLGC